MDMSASLNNSMLEKSVPSASISSRQNINSERARGVSDDFESFFLFQMLELMETDLSNDPNMGGGVGEEMFNHMKNERIADEMTQRGGVGLSDTIYGALMKLQEVE